MACVTEQLPQVLVSYDDSRKSSTVVALPQLLRPHSSNVHSHSIDHHKKLIPFPAGDDHHKLITSCWTSSGSTRVLVIGSTGYIGRFVTEASIKSGRRTYVLSRPESNDQDNVKKSDVLNSLREAGATVLTGSIKDKDFMRRILRDFKISVVISAVGGGTILEQLDLIDVIKSVPTVKRFLPSEFGHDIDRTDPVEPGLTMYNQKRKIRRALEAAGIPYTYICCNSIAGWPYFDQTHPSELPPPLDRFQIYGDGNVKAYFVTGEDIGKFTMKAVDDPRTVNKMLHFRPHLNFLTVNELASLWESKVKKTIPRVFLTETDLLSIAKENCIPRSIVASLTHDIFINGCQFKFSIDGPGDVDVAELYPEESYETVDQCFESYMKGINASLLTSAHIP